MKMEMCECDISGICPYQYEHCERCGCMVEVETIDEKNIFSTGCRNDFCDSEYREHE